MAERTRNPNPVTQLECRVCRAVVSLPGAGAERRFRCPKCLNEISLRDDAPPAEAPAPSDHGELTGVTAADGEPPTAVRHRIAELQQEVASLRAERDALAERLDAATSALREASSMIARIADLEQRICDLGTRTLEATFRVMDLERENARLRRPDAGPPEAR